MVLSAGAAGLMAAGSVLSSAMGMAAANHGMHKQFKYNSKLQKEAAKLNYKYAAKSAKNQPTWNRTGLEAAGYNPMLAVQNSTAGANSSWTSNSSVNAPDYAGLGVGDVISNATRMKEISNETATAESTVDRNYAEADNLKSQSAINNAKLPFVSERERKEIANVQAQSAKLENDIHYQDEMLKYYSNSLKLQEMGLEPQIINAGANATNADTARKQYLIDKEVQDIIRDKEKRYKEWGKKHPILRNVDETISRYFSGIGASGSLSRSTIKK